MDFDLSLDHWFCLWGLVVGDKNIFTVGLVYIFAAPVSCKLLVAEHTDALKGGVVSLHLLLLQHRLLQENTETAVKERKRWTPPTLCLWRWFHWDFCPNMKDSQDVSAEASLGGVCPQEGHRTAGSTPPVSLERQTIITDLWPQRFSNWKDSGLELISGHSRSVSQCMIRKLTDWSSRVGSKHTAKVSDWLLQESALPVQQVPETQRLLSWECGATEM